MLGRQSSSSLQAGFTWKPAIDSANSLYEGKRTTIDSQARFSIRSRLHLLSHYYAMSSSKIEVRFLVDKEKKRVIFAEAGSDFVDILFSLLTLPLGRIAQLLTWQSLDNLYNSADELDAKHLQTYACKEMLLHPRTAAALQCEDLKFNIMHEANPRRIYTCRELGCLIKKECYYTFKSGGPCSRCGKLMDKILDLPKETSGKGGVFVNDTVGFMITDDLQVMPISLSKTFSLLEELQINDGGVIDERVIHFGAVDVLNFVEKLFESNNPLTEICFPDSYVRATGDFILPSKEKIVADQEAENEIGLELFLNEKNNEVLFAVVGEDFVNLLFSFLTFPLGSLFQIFSDNISSLGGCIKNLYSSVEKMDLDCFKSEICRNMLLTPKLPTFYGLKNQLLGVEEITPTKSTMSMRCVKCYLDNAYRSAPCMHGIKESEFIEQNPKSNNGGAFVVSSIRFMVSDSLQVTPLSAISAISTILDEMDISFSDLFEIKVFLDRGKARSLLGAMMSSKTVLTDVFSPKLKRQRKSM